MDPSTDIIIQEYIPDYMIEVGEDPSLDNIKLDNIKRELKKLCKRQEYWSKLENWIKYIMCFGIHYYITLNPYFKAGEKMHPIKKSYIKELESLGALLEKYEKETPAKINKPIGEIKIKIHPKDHRFVAKDHLVSIQNNILLYRIFKELTKFYKKNKTGNLAVEKELRSYRKIAIEKCFPFSQFLNIKAGISKNKSYTFIIGFLAILDFPTEDLSPERIKQIYRHT